MRGQLGLLLGAPVAGTALAAAFGAANFGTALGFGQLCFAAALVWVLLRDGSPDASERVRPSRDRG